MGCIYKWTNTINGKAYIGKCYGDVKRRKKQHITGNGGSRLLKRSIDKYGLNTFTFEIIHDGILDIFLDLYEVEAIKNHNTIAPHGYNLTTGGEGGKYSEESKIKMAQSHTLKCKNDAEFFFTSLSSEVSLRGKRELLRQKYPHVKNETICRWVREWCKKHNIIDVKKQPKRTGNGHQPTTKMTPMLIKLQTAAVIFAQRGGCSAKEIADILGVPVNSIYDYAKQPEWNETLDLLGYTGNQL